MPITHPVDTIAKLLILTERRVQQLAREGILRRIHEALYIAAREQAGKEASPTTAIIDSQSAKASQKGALDWTRKAMTQARRSRDASATSSSIRSDFC